MLDDLLARDAALQTWVEEQLRADWLDVPMLALSSFALFAPALALVLVLLVWRGGPKERRLALVALALVVVTDQLTAGALRPLFARPRPHSTSYGFPSSHAANTFGQAALVARLYPRWGWTLLGVAAAVSFSRVYLGRHYPLDVVAGALVGGACGLAAAWATRRYQAQLDAAWARAARLWGRFRPSSNS